MEGYKPQDFSFFHRSEKLVQPAVKQLSCWYDAEATKANKGFSQKATSKYQKVGKHTILGL